MKAVNSQMGKRDGMHKILFDYTYKGVHWLVNFVSTKHRPKNLDAK